MEAENVREGSLARIGIALSDWFERWLPDAFAFGLIAVVVVFIASLAVGNSPIQTASWFGGGFWELAKFTMQMVMILITGYAVATAPPVYRMITRLAGLRFSPRGAVTFVALFSMIASLFSWSFSLIFSGLLAREIATRVKGADYRAIGAAAYLGLGSVWALGLSSSAALLMANAGSMPPALLKITGVIPLTQTLLLWQSMLMAVVLLVLSMTIAHWSAPSAQHARSPESLGVIIQPLEIQTKKPETPGEAVEYNPLLSVLLVMIGAAYLIEVLVTQGAKRLLDLDNYIFLFLLLGLLLHGRPRSFVKSVGESVRATAGILIQYPLYAGILKMMTESGLAERLAHFFVSISTANTFPLLVGIYSAFLGLFVPSAGGKWLIEAPYLMEAAKSLHVHAGWVVQTYNAAEALPNLIHPFWMLPLLGILQLRARDIIGYSALQFTVHVPVVLFLVWLLNLTLS